MKRKEGLTFLGIVAAFLLAYFLPLGVLRESPRLANAIWESLYLVQDYAREHVLLCLVPAFFIAGAIGTFINQQGVMTYLGAGAKRVVAYGVASVSGTILAVCSCTVLPLFAGIYRMGAGLGPACTFLYAGPAINVLAIILTARILGLELGIARAVCAILFSIVIGLLMELFFRREEAERAAAVLPETQPKHRLYQTALHFLAMVGILVFANWSGKETSGLWGAIYAVKWWIAGGFGGLFAVLLVRWFDASLRLTAAGALLVIAAALLFPQQPLIAFVTGVALLSLLCRQGNEELQSWGGSTWIFAKQILPLLFFGVLVAGALLGRPGEEGLIPAHWVADLVGGNGLGANFFAAVAGAMMYFATLTEVPILQGLLGNGMGQGPALALLLAGPALSLPNMLVIRSVLGTKKTIVFVVIVVVMAALSGYGFGMMI